MIWCETGSMILTRENLLKAGACYHGLKSFDERVKGNSGYEWTAEEAKRIYQKDKSFLQFLETRKLVPMLEVEGVPSVAERLKAIEDSKPY